MTSSLQVTVAGHDQQSTSDCCWPQVAVYKWLLLATKRSGPFPWHWKLRPPSPLLSTTGIAAAQNNNNNNNNSNNNNTRTIQYLHSNTIQRNDNTITRTMQKQTTQQHTKNNNTTYKNNRAAPPPLQQRHTTTTATTTTATTPLWQQSNNSEQNVYSYRPLRSATDMAHCESVLQPYVAHFYTGLASTAHYQIVCHNEASKISRAFLKEVFVFGVGETLAFTLIQRWNCISLFLKPYSLSHYFYVTFFK